MTENQESPYLLQMAADISDLVHYSEDLRTLMEEETTGLEASRPQDFSAIADRLYEEARALADGLPFASVTVWIQAFCESLQSRWEA